MSTVARRGPSRGERLGVYLMARQPALDRAWEAAGLLTATTTAPMASLAALWDAPVGVLAAGTLLELDAVVSSEADEATLLRWTPPAWSPPMVDVLKRIVTPERSMEAAPAPSGDAVGQLDRLMEPLVRARIRLRPRPHTRHLDLPDAGARVGGLHGSTHGALAARSWSRTWKAFCTMGRQPHLRRRALCS